ncbi:hypothetical protein [Streptomyces cavernae]|uniref:hypothetical protein n=1 Tax=Streptomyces cavernae TaxID=2259034 RepID=UPI000FEC0273|nr:hypothetical protein [Streptomyces cavernae]
MRRALAATVALGVAALPVHTAVADTPGPYSYAPDARTIEGAQSTTDAEQLNAGATYRSSIPFDGKLYYRLELDSRETAYVSATAVPGPAATVSYADGIKVSIQDGDGHRCFSGESANARFGATAGVRPITAWSSVSIGPDESTCRTSGTYYMLVERTSGTDSAPGRWNLELQYVSEPAVRSGGPTVAPKTWDSASPEALVGEPRSRPGGTGFSDARALGQGVWTGRIGAGQTLFYRVPVDWGQQLHTTAELGTSSGDGIVGSALVMQLYNPVRGFVDDVGAAYGGSQRTAGLEPLPPVRYENRYALADRTSAMRFAGWYYLVLHLSPEVAEKFGDGPLGLTLRVRVSGTAQSGPSYDGVAEPRDVFEVSAGDREAAASGSEQAGPRDEKTAMKLLAAGGIGTGVVLVAGLGVWTLVARRRAAGAQRG